MTPAEAQPPAPHQRANARFYLCAALFLLLSCALLTYLWMPRGPREPEYNGRTLTQWIDEAIINRDNPPIRQECEAAVRSIGTNGLPYLLKLIDTPNEPWRETVNLWGKLIGFRKSIFTPVWFNKALAQDGLAILGPLAQPVLPELLTRLSLARTTDHRSFIVGYIAAIGPAAEAAIPDLMKLARSGGQDERSYATIALGEIGRRPEIAVPFLTDQLADPDRHIRFVAMKTLEKFSTNAVSATPAFVKLLTDPETSVRETATNTLRLINPAAAAAAGIK